MLDYGDSKNLIHSSPDLAQKVTGSGPVLTPLFFNTDNLVLFRFALPLYPFSLLSGYCCATLEKIYRVVQSLEPPLSWNCLSETALPYCTSNKHLMGKIFYETSLLLFDITLVINRTEIPNNTLPMFISFNCRHFC